MEGAAFAVSATALRPVQANDAMRAIVDGLVPGRRTAAPVPDWLARCAARGLSFVFWEPKDGKGPRDSGWPRKPYPLDLYRDGMQVGVKLGTEIAPERHLHAVDRDWADNRVVGLMDRLLPRSEFLTYRASKTPSQIFFTCPTAHATKKYDDVRPRDDDGRATIVELRGAKVNGAVGAQSMIAGLHPTGERVCVHDGEIGHADDLPRRVALLAAASLLVRHLPNRGFRHDDGRLPAAGFLMKDCKLSEQEAVDVCEAVAEATGNDVADVRLAVGTTAQRLRAGQKVSGRTALAKLIGDDAQKVLARVREWLNPDDAATDLDVVMRGGDLSAIVDRGEAALIASGAPIYKRGSGVLVRPVRLDRADGEPGNVRREAGAIVLVPVREPWLLEQMGRVLRWVKVRADGGRTICDPAPIYPRTLLGRSEWAFSELRGIVTAPTLDRDGRIIEAPGYDKPSKLLLDFPPSAFPAVPAEPTQEDARRALDLLAEPLRGFPFIDDPSRAVALSALLTALVRPSMRTAPLHGFDAPTAGTGKSLLAEMAGLLASGVRPPALSQGKSPEEDEKRLSTVLMAGDPVIHIDNCERALSGDFLCSMLTQEVVQARILGLSERRVMPSVALVLASGNNLTFAGDTSRRAVICRLDARVERPDTREFDFDCHEEVIANRAALVVAGLTVLRAYVVAGRPVKLTPMGSFADYEWIRSSLVWLGCADPADTRAAILDSDPRRDELTTVMDAWEDQIGKTTRIDVASIADRDLALKTLLQDVTGTKVWSPKSVGWWLRRHKDRVVGGRAFRCATRGNKLEWWLAEKQGELWTEGTQGEPPEWMRE
jgi:hypothetical protein